VQQAIGGASLAQCHIQRGLGQILFHARIHRPTDDFSSIQVHDYGQIQPSFSGRHIRDIGHPFSIRAIGRKITVQSIRGYRMSMPTIRRRTKPPSTLAGTESGLLHQTCDAVASPRTPWFCNASWMRGLPTVVRSGCRSSGYAPASVDFRSHVDFHRVVAKRSTHCEEQPIHGTTPSLDNGLVPAR